MANLGPVKMLRKRMMVRLQWLVMALQLGAFGSLCAQDTIFLRGDTIRVGELEWEIEKQWPMKRDWLTKHVEFYGEDVLILHKYYRRGVVEQISFGYMGNTGFVEHGPTRYYYASGDLLGKRIYRDGKLEGLAEDYFTTRRPKMIAHFRDGLIDGEYFTFWEDGTPESIAQFEAGKQVGEEKWFYSNGVLKEIVHYADGVRHGPDSTWYESGDLESVMIYRQGELDGLVRFQHRNGQPWTERLYENGKLQSIAYLKNETGKPLAMGDFADGNGRVNVYSESSRLLAIEKYVEGECVSTKTVKDKRLNGK